MKSSEALLEFPVRWKLVSIKKKTNGLARLKLLDSQKFEGIYQHLLIKTLITNMYYFKPNFI